MPNGLALPPHLCQLHECVNVARCHHLLEQSSSQRRTSSSDLTRGAAHHSDSRWTPPPASTFRLPFAIAATPATPVDVLQLLFPFVPSLEVYKRLHDLGISSYFDPLINYCAVVHICLWLVADSGHLALSPSLGLLCIFLKIILKNTQLMGIMLHIHTD